MRKKAILKLYYEYQMNKNNSEEYGKLLRKFNILRGEFDNKISRKQRKELENLFYLIKCMNIIENKEYFIEGYSIGTRLATEVFYKEES